MTTNDFIKQCKKSCQFDYRQMYEIRLGLHSGLTLEQVKVYANPDFNNDQMQQIRWGLIDGLTIKQVKLYANPEFEWFEMDRICEFIKENNITNMSTKTIKFLLGLNCI